jgi:hypothetical protein
MPQTPAEETAASLVVVMEFKTRVNNVMELPTALHLALLLVQLQSKPLKSIRQASHPRELLSMRTSSMLTWRDYFLSKNNLDQIDDQPLV